MCIRFNETDVRVTGRVSMGVIGMRFEEDDEVIGMQMESQGESLLIVSENGMGKRTVISESAPRTEAERVSSVTSARKKQAIS